MVRHDVYSWKGTEIKGNDKFVSVVLFKSKIAEIYLVSATTINPFGLFRGS